MVELFHCALIPVIILRTQIQNDVHKGNHLITSLSNTSSNVVW